MRLRDLREPFLRVLVPLTDLGFNDPPLCEHKSHQGDEPAQYVAGGKVQGGFWAGWRLCERHARAFARATGLPMPPMKIGEEELTL